MRSSGPARRSPCCRSGCASTEGTPPDATATMEGLTNGTVYDGEVAAVGPTGAGAWTPAGGSVTPIGRPPAPAKPAVDSLNGGVRIQVTPEAGALVSRYR